MDTSTIAISRTTLAPSRVDLTPLIDRRDAGACVQSQRRALWGQIRGRDPQLLSVLTDIATKLDEHGCVRLICPCPTSERYGELIREALESFEWCWICQDALTRHCDVCDGYHCSSCNMRC